ncbi:MAG: hypothetical protein Q9160_003528 [Pyrenula sp. 1 TL-2023]
MASPFAPASQTPLHRNPPLAPSQELAYRKKCIDLRRRLTEIEQHNDTIRSRINRERTFHDKMRLNRAILMQHLKDVIEGKRLGPEEAEAVRAAGAGGNLAARMGYDGNMTGIDTHARSQYIDDETEISGDEELPEPQERPLRSKRSQNYGRDQSVSNNQVASSSMNGTPYTAQQQPATLPQLAPSPAPHHPTEPIPYAQSATAPTPPTSYNLPPPQPSTTYSPSLPHPHPPHPYYGHAPPPGQPPQSTYGPHSPTMHTGPPKRPTAPLDAFVNQNLPEYLSRGMSEHSATHELTREWHASGSVVQRPYQQAYEEEMRQYEWQKDEWKRSNKSSGDVGGSKAGFRAVNQ